MADQETDYLDALEFWLESNDWLQDSQDKTNKELSNKEITLLHYAQLLNNAKH